MVWFLLRGVGLLVLAFGGLAAIVDGAQTVAAEEVVTTALGQTWYQLNAASLDGLQALIRDGLPAGVGPAIWDTIFVAILRAPTFLVLGVIGSLILIVARRRRRRDDILALR